MSHRQLICIAYGAPPDPSFIRKNVLNFKQEAATCVRDTNFNIAK